MYQFTLTTLMLSILLHSVNAWVIPPTIPSLFSKRGDAASQVKGILANPNACPQSTGECVTPGDAVGPILSGLSRYGIQTAAEQAAIVSLMAFESVDFQYNHNISPGRPGQGTRAMLMPNYIKMYIDSLPDLASAASATGGDVSKMLALVQDNGHSFAAASWFYSTQCSDGVKSQVKTGSQAGWSAYMQCVGVNAGDSNRIAYWKRACQQLSVSGS